MVQMVQRTCAARPGENLLEAGVFWEGHREAGLESRAARGGRIGWLKRKDITFPQRGIDV